MKLTPNLLFKIFCSNRKIIFIWNNRVKVPNILIWLAIGIKLIQFEIRTHFDCWTKTFDWTNQRFSLGIGLSWLCASAHCSLVARCVKSQIKVDCFALETNWISKLKVVFKVKFRPKFEKAVRWSSKLKIKEWKLVKETTRKRWPSRAPKPQMVFKRQKPKVRNKI